MRLKAYHVALLILVCCACIADPYVHLPREGAARTSRTLVTAAHIGEIEGYTLVYSDTETDYAVHVKNSYVATGVSIGDKVRLAGTAGEVASVSDKDFTVAVDNISKIVPGVSGTPVYHLGSSVGFISGWNGDGTLRCIFY